MTDTNRRDFLRKASFGDVAVGAVATVPELLMSVPELVVVQPGFPLRGVEGFLDGPTVCRPVSASAAETHERCACCPVLDWCIGTFVAKPLTPPGGSVPARSPRHRSRLRAERFQRAKAIAYSGHHYPADVHRRSRRRTPRPA